MKKTNNFRRTLQNLLIISGTNAAELALSLGIGLPVVNRWLNGSAAPDVYQLQKIADWFGMPCSYFFEGEQAHSVSDIAARLGLREETIELLEALSDTEPEEVLDALDDAVFVLVSAICTAREVDAE